MLRAEILRIAALGSAALLPALLTAAEPAMVPGFAHDYRTAAVNWPGAPQQGTRFVFYPPVSGVHKDVAPDLRGRSWSVTTEVAAGDAAGTGVLLAFGGRFAGYALYVHEGRLKFHYNYAGEERTTITSADPLPATARQLGASFTLTPDGGADVFLSVDGREAGHGHVPRRLLNITHETFDLGCDLYTPVSEDYASPATFTGTLQKVTLEAAPRQP